MIIHPFLPSENTFCCSKHGSCQRFRRTLPRGKIGACFIQYKLIYLSDALARLWAYFLVMWHSDDIRYFQIHFESKNDDSVIHVQFGGALQLCRVIGKMLSGLQGSFLPQYCNWPLGNSGCKAEQRCHVRVNIVHFTSNTMRPLFGSDWSVNSTAHSLAISDMSQSIYAVLNLWYRNETSSRQGWHS